ncbi:MAG: DUF5317 domain-containing protein, partial [Alicyclobacillaceae bacterium]|nr:DUF5317 domain-containing protein [Alicyclobacillaceae bacterium]
MAFQFLVILAGLVLGWVRGGSVWSITQVRLRYIWVLPAAYVLQHVSIHDLHGVLYQVVIVLSYLALLLFCAVNFRVPGITWAFAGTLANFVVMAVNHLRMPAYLEAVKRIDPSAVGPLQRGEMGKSIAMSAHTHLNFLGDIFPITIWPQSIISIGDIVFSIGL